MRNVDFAVEFVALVKEHATIDPSTARRIETDIRNRWGGSEVRIPERPLPPPVTLDQVNNLLLQRKSVNQVANECGVSRSTIYRLITKKSHRSKVGETAS